jgi:hypothetical protein
MAQFTNLILTEKGLALQTKAQTGTQLKFTRVAIGDGTLDAGDSLIELTGLKRERMSVAIANLSIENGSAIIKANFSNKDLTESFYLRELGVFASDPAEGEILYAVSNAGDQGDYLPADSGNEVIEQVFTLSLMVGTATDVTAIFAESIYVLKAGDTMTGPLVLSGDPTEDLGAVTKQYVDTKEPSPYQLPQPFTTNGSMLGVWPHLAQKKRDRYFRAEYDKARISDILVIRDYAYLLLRNNRILKIDINTMKEVIPSTNVPCSTNNEAKFVTDGTYIYVGANTGSVDQVLKYDLDLNLLGKLGSGTRDFSWIGYASGFVYILTTIFGGNAGVVKIDPKTMTVVSFYEFSYNDISPNTSELGSFVIENDIMYLGFTFNTKVAALNLSTMTLVGSVVAIDSTQGNTARIGIKDSYLYVVSKTYPTHIAKLNKSTLTLVGSVVTLNLSGTTYNINNMLIDDYIYMIGGYNATILARASLDTLTQVGTTLKFGKGDAWYNCLYKKGSMVYVGTQGTSAYEFFRVNAGDNLAMIDSVLLDNSEYPMTSICYDGIYIYVGLGTSPAKLIKVDPINSFDLADSNFMRNVASLTLSSGSNICKSLLYDGKYIYMGLGTSPARLVKIDPVTMTEVKYVELSSANGENVCNALTYDGKYIYMGLGTSPGKVVAVNPDTMTQVTTLTLATGETPINALAFDGTYLYAGLGTSPAKLIRITSGSLYKWDSGNFTAASGENVCNALLFDGTYIYMGLGTSPFKLIKVALNTSTAMAAVGTTLTGVTYENCCMALTYDGKYIYVGLDPGTGLSQCIKVDPNGTGSLTKVGVTFNFPSGDIVAMTCDGVNIYAALSSYSVLSQRDLLTYHY